MWGTCKLVSRNKGRKTRAGKAADKVSVSGMIHCSTQGLDLDQGRAMTAAERERERERERDCRFGGRCLDFSKNK